MYCKLCGKKITSDKEYCEQCQSIVCNEVTEEPKIISSENNYRVYNDRPNPLLNIVAILFPIAGLVFALTDMRVYPKRSKSLLIFSIIGILVGILGGILRSCYFMEYDYYDFPEEDAPDDGAGHSGGGGTLFSIMNTICMIIR